MKNINRRNAIGLLATGVVAGQLGVKVTKANASPKKGGRLRVAMGHGSTTDTLDPTFLTNELQLAMNFAMYNMLTEIAADNSLVGELAERWESTPDAKTWTIFLRKGVEFHDAKPLQIDDVIATFNHHRGPDSKSGVRAIVDQIADIKKDGDQSIRIMLKEGNADFPYLISSFNLTILPVKDGKIDPLGGIGTGPYILEAFEPGVRTLLKRNPRYWKEGRAHFDQIELLSVQDATARANALMAGEVDINYSPDTRTVGLLTANESLRLYQVTGAQHYTMPMKTIEAPFNDYHIRNALKWSIDRQQIVDKILNGFGSVANDTPIGPSYRYMATNDELPQRVYDPDKAKFHLKKAGVSSLRVAIHPAETAWAGAIDTCLLYSDSAKTAGIDIEVVREADDGYWDSVWMKKPWSLSYWGGRSTEDWMFSFVYQSSAKNNESFWKNERFDDLLVKARTVLDDAKRRDMYVEMQKILHDEGGTVIPVFTDFLSVMSSRIKHEQQVARNGNLDGMKFSERWWIEDV